MRYGSFGLAAGLAVLAMACGSPAPSNESAPAPAAAAAPGGGAGDHGEHGGAARVFFVEPKDGASVKSPVHLVFGAEGIEVSAVPAGEVTEPRPNVVHHHLGVEQDCLPPGQEIVKGTPSWVHFGKGDAVFDLQLTPGPHKLSLQAGNDLHKTAEGLCQTINITVTE